MAGGISLGLQLELALNCSWNCAWNCSSNCSHHCMAQLPRPKTRIGRRKVPGTAPALQQPLWPQVAATGALSGGSSRRRLEHHPTGRARRRIQRAQEVNQSKKEPKKVSVRPPAYPAPTWILPPVPSSRSEYRRNGRKTKTDRLIGCMAAFALALHIPLPGLQHPEDRSSTDPSVFSKDVKMAGTVLPKGRATRRAWLQPRPHRRPLGKSDKRARVPLSPKRAARAKLASHGRGACSCGLQ